MLLILRHSIFIQLRKAAELRKAVRKYLHAKTAETLPLIGAETLP
jgi:hypothetical protein